MSILLESNAKQTQKFLQEILPNIDGSILVNGMELQGVTEIKITDYTENSAVGNCLLICFQYEDQGNAILELVPCRDELKIYTKIGEGDFLDLVFDLEKREVTG